jgi:4Fe-4S ferredoxin
MEKQRERTAVSCKKPSGKIHPVVNFGRCEGKADCIAVFPENVFGVHQISENDYTRLTLLQKFKQRLHGVMLAYTSNANTCRSCGLCVATCPEKAITRKRDGLSAGDRS